MAKTYADSVKLPNLVAVPHPSTKFLPKNGLNVEGVNSQSRSNGSLSFSSNSLDRKNFIVSILGKVCLIQIFSLFQKN
jgi:hypothetical protein